VQEFTTQMIHFMWEPLLAAVKKAPEPELTATMLDRWAVFIRPLPPATRLRQEQDMASSSSSSDDNVWLPAAIKRRADM
jgi:hypothetical protein